MKGILPTTLNLITRFINVELECKRCGLEFESIEHALRDCSGGAECWSSSNLAIPVPLLNEPMDEWLLRCKTTMRGEDVELLVTLLWAIWFGRSQAILSGCVTDIDHCP